MGTHMKTTIEIADALLEEAKTLAKDEGTTLRSLVEAGLRHEIDRRAAVSSFRLRDASFQGGEGLNPEFQEGDWPRIRAEIYKDQGG